MACGARLECGFLLPYGHYEKIVNRLLGRLQQQCDRHAAAFA